MLLPRGSGRSIWRRNGSSGSEIPGEIWTFGYRDYGSGDLGAVEEENYEDSAGSFGERVWRGSDRRACQRGFDGKDQRLSGEELPDSGRAGRTIHRGPFTGERGECGGSVSAEAAFKRAAGAVFAVCTSDFLHQSEWNGWSIWFGNGGRCQSLQGKARYECRRADGHCGVGKAEKRNSPDSDRTGGERLCGRKYRRYCDRGCLQGRTSVSERSAYECGRNGWNADEGTAFWRRRWEGNSFKHPSTGLQWLPLPLYAEHAFGAGLFCENQRDLR